MADVGHASMLHVRTLRFLPRRQPINFSVSQLVTAYLGVLVGGITFTGSIVAFMKLSGRMSSKPLVLPMKHLVNGGIMGLNALTMGAFLSAAPTVPLVAAGYLGANTLLSFISGYTTTAAVGGADMRE